MRFFVLIAALLPLLVAPPPACAQAAPGAAATRAANTVQAASVQAASVPAASPIAAPTPAATRVPANPVATAAASAPVATRAVSAAEMASFAASLPLLVPGAAAPAPVFAAERAAGARTWTVGATVDDAPARGAGQLCHLRRTRFAHQPQAPAAQRWRIDGVSQYAWLGATGACVAPARPVALLQALPDTDVLAAYAKLVPLLQRARLLMAGNSSCAVFRSDNLRLAAMGVSAPPVGAEQMLVLRFESDRGSDAQVWVRRRALELEAWAVACAPR